MLILEFVQVQTDLFFFNKLVEFLFRSATADAQFKIEIETFFVSLMLVNQNFPGSNRPFLKKYELNLTVNNKHCFFHNGRS